MRAWLPQSPASGNSKSTFIIERPQRGKPKDAARVAQVTRPRILDTLDLAEQWKGELERGEVKHFREFARRQGITPARVSQIYALNRLHPAISDFVRANAVTTERRLKPLLSLEHADQLRAAPTVVVGWGEGSQAPSRRSKRAR